MKKVLMLLAAFFFLATDFQGQNVAIKTNLIYWATTTPNISVEVKTARKYTFDLAVHYNAWSFKNDMTLRHYLFQPEYRFWPCKAFEGHFVGLHALYGRYNIGNIPFLHNFDTYTFRGYMSGGGVSYGYHWALGRRWGMEANIGLGYIYLDYKKYVYGECCAELVGRYKRNYFGPTKAGFSIIYLF